jgi:HAD superfamily hydrolase (TIGR01509 family)
MARRGLRHARPPQLAPAWIGMIKVMDELAAVIFDFDGIILDTETAVFESYRQIYERCGITLTPEEWCDQIGIYAEGYADRWTTRLRALSDRAPDAATFEAEQRQRFRGLVSDAPMRGIRELISRLEAAGVPMAIASTSPANWVLPAAERLGIGGSFQAIVTGDEVERRKPAPDVYLEAARRIGAAPSRTVAIEDSAPGIAAARAAGMRTVAIPHWLTERHDLTAADLRVVHAGELTPDLLARLVQERIAE